MVTICQQCGDRGFTEALINCDKCQATAVHRYCLCVLPASFDDDVIWYCEDCEPMIAKPSTLDNLSSLLHEKCDSENLEIVLTNLPGLRLKKIAFNRLKKKKQNRRHVSGSLGKAEVHKCKNGSRHHLEVPCSENHEKDQQFGRQRELDGSSFYEEAESVKTKTSLIASGKSSDQESELVKTRTSEVVTNDLRNTPQCSSTAHKEPNLEKNFSGNNKKRKKFRRWRKLVRKISDAEIESVKTSPVASSSPLSIPKYDPNVCATSIIKVQRNENDEKDQRLIRWMGSDGGSSIEEAESGKIETSSVAASKPSNIPRHDCYMPTQPIIEPIWKGNLRLCNYMYGTIEGLVAHLSTSACSKVFQEAKLLPELLCPELLPRSNAWPKSFCKWGPNDDHIALYLFPNNERDEKIYDRLVEDMIGHDLAMRIVVKNAELLLFSSKLLPFQSWRFQSKFYLWGVFRGKQASQSRAVAIYSLNPISVAEPKDPVYALTWHTKRSINSFSNSGSYSSGSAMHFQEKKKRERKTVVSWRPMEIIPLEFRDLHTHFTRKFLNFLSFSRSWEELLKVLKPSDLSLLIFGSVCFCCTIILKVW